MDLSLFSIGLQRKIAHSIELLQKAEKLALAYDKDRGFWLAFSGGKDSQALLHVAQLAGVKFRAHMNLTSVDPPEVIRFVREYYPDIEMIPPKKSIYTIAKEKKILPTHIVRWCCAEYKEGAGAGFVTLIGIRHEESMRRAKRNEVEISNRKFSGNLEGLDEYRKSKGIDITNADSEKVVGCIKGKETLLISPIIDWTEADVWEFLNKLGVAHCKLYDEGQKRIGCLLCPMSTKKQKIRELKRYPHLRSRWIEVCKVCVKREGSLFDDPEDLFEWWISKQSVKEYKFNKRQTKLQL